MRNYIKQNLQFLLVIIVWLMAGIYGGPSYFVIVPLTCVLFWRKGLMENLFIGFFALLIFSDSFYLPFAKDIKPVVLLLMGLIFFYNQKSFSPIVRLASPFIIFFIYAVILLLNSETFWTSFQKTLSYILLFLIVPNYMITIYRKEGAEFFKRLIYFVIFLLFAGFAFIVVNPELASSHGERYRGIFGNPNGIAMFCVLIYMMFTVLNQYFPKLFSKSEKILFLSGVFVSVILSGSRTSMMCFAIFWIFSTVQKKSPWLSLFLFLLIAIANQVVTINIVEIVSELGLNKYLRIDTLKEGSGRIFAWRYAWQEIQSNFWFGKGFDYNQYLFFIPKVQHRLNDLNHQGDVHNVYLGFWLDVGLVGLILYFVPFILTFYKASKQSHYAFPIMYAMLFMGNYEPWLIASLNPYTIQFLMIVTIIIYCKEEELTIFSGERMALK